MTPTTHADPHHVTIYFAELHQGEDYQHANAAHSDVQLPPGSYVTFYDGHAITMQLLRLHWLARAFRTQPLFDD